ncbi:MAG: DUF1152 domain-containing protein, partial [Halobacteria archaeon]|nr:DUF1152 domain-containing protein [Halobacteria archaeon]
VFGYGSDGELTLEELEDGIQRAAERDGLLGAWGITQETRKEMEEVLKRVDTEASRLPVEAARGEYGERRIRDGSVSVRLTPPSIVTFYFDPSSVVATSEITSYVYGSESTEEIRESLKEAGIRNEFDLEKERLERS